MVSPRNRREPTDASRHFRKFRAGGQVQIPPVGWSRGVVFSP
ncbi:MAG: hypothetical protein RLZZ447_2071 [Verrucomicrobiota bacterium]